MLYREIIHVFFWNPYKTQKHSMYVESRIFWTLNFVIRVVTTGLLKLRPLKIFCNMTKQPPLLPVGQVSSLSRLPDHIQTHHSL